jgi:peptide chain release factor 1
MADFLEKIVAGEERARALEEQLADPELAQKPSEYQRLGKQLAVERPLVEVGGRYRAVISELADAREMLADDEPEIAEMARADLDRLSVERNELEQKLRELLVPTDPNDVRNAILEIRAGTGGDEAALFAADLFRMYHRHADRVGWKVEQMSASETPGGGFKEIIALVSGTGVFRDLKYERGVHRVQRVPATESQGRVHTSTVTVAVMPEAEEVDVQINPSDLRVDVMRAGGPGGQSVNTTDSAVRLTHLPTGLIVQCQDEKSQHKNKAKAMKVLLSRLLELEQQRAADERASERREQVGTGERSEKIRTYNYAQNRVTDHRAGVTLHKLEVILEGDLDELLSAIRLELSENFESPDPDSTGLA